MSLLTCGNPALDAKPRGGMISLLKFHKTCDFFCVIYVRIVDWGPVNADALGQNDLTIIVVCFILKSSLQ